MLKGGFYVHHFGSLLKQLRLQQGLTQIQLAQRLNITKAMVSAYENSLRFPSYDILIKISRIFHTSTDYLLGLESAKAINVDGLTDNQIALISQLVSEFQISNKTEG